VNDLLLPLFARLPVTTIKCKHWTLVPLHSAHALKGYEKGDDVIIPDKQ
jgi:hypothetical protein